MLVVCKSVAWATVVIAVFALSGCGSDSTAGRDAGVTDPEPDARDPNRCGDGLVSGDEQCDDSNSSDEDSCLSDCTLACGDGVVNDSEACDTGIAEGEGACPSSCADDDACTEDTLTGDACAAACVYSTITDRVDGDGCCPAGASAGNDSDCTASCDNGIVEPGEACDTGIAAGEVGACPTECVDDLACTADTLSDAGTCQAMCSFPEITSPADGDGCCPPGATVATDDDCSANCGDGVFSPDEDETCDIAIPSGAGACPDQAACVDGNACTTDQLLSAGTCSAQCANPAITEIGPAEGCCPPGASSLTDPDCEPVCGNDVKEAGEQCDDGGKMPGDGCDADCNLEPAAFRMTSMALRDPHAFALVFNVLCVDVTDQLNEQFGTSIGTDDPDDPDGLLDLSLLTVFRPYDKTAASTPVEIRVGDCTAPASSTMCTPNADDTPIFSTASNMASGTCLAPEPGTTSGYNPAVTSTTGTCFASGQETLDIDVNGLVISLKSAQVAARYVGTDQLTRGLIKGFIAEADADTTILPDSLPVVGGKPLSSVFPGGSGNCSDDDTRDTGPNGEIGWWMYLNFTAERVPWSE